MSAAYLSWTTDAGLSKSLFFDVVTEIGVELSSATTEHPVEDGVNVSDHVKKELDKVNLEVFVSNAPIEDINDRGGRVSTIPIKLQHYKAPLAPTPGAVFNAIGGALKDAVGSLLGKKEEYGVQVLQWDDSFDAVADTLTILENLKNTAQLVDIFMSARDFSNMFLEKIDLQKNAGTGTGATFHLSFKEIRKVKVRLVNAPVPTETRAQLQKPKGAQGSKDAPAQGPKKSVAKGIVDNGVPEEVANLWSRVRGAAAGL